MPITYSSNNEESFIKSTGPIRIIDSGTSLAGVVLPKEVLASITIIYGKSNIYGKNIVPDKLLSSDKGFKSST